MPPVILRPAMSIADAAAAYQTALTHDTPQLRAANAQALNLFLRYLHNSKLSPSRTAITSLQPSAAVTFLSHLQATRSIETEHLYSRTVLNFYKAIHTSVHSIDTRDLLNLQTYYSTHRRQKSHDIQPPPVEAIQQLLQYVVSTSPPFTANQSPRRHLQFLRDQALLLTLADTGLRTSEMCNLRKQQADTATRQIHLQPDYSLDLTSRSSTFIHHYLAQRSSQDRSQTTQAAITLPLFARHDKKAGRRILPISRWTVANIIDHWLSLALTPELRATLLAHKQSVTSMTFRHCFVLTTLATTKDLDATMHIARHKDRATTRKYLHHISKRS